MSENPTQYELQKKQALTQIVAETGLSGDYFNEFGQILQAFLSLDRTEALDWIAELAKTSPLKKYSDRFSNEVYPEFSITEKNAAAIARLDDIIDEINALLRQPKLDIDRCLTLCAEAELLVFGKKDGPGRTTEVANYLNQA